MITVTTTDGVTFNLPETGDVNWDDVTPYLVHLRNAIMNGGAATLQQFATTPVSITVAEGATIPIGNRSTFIVSSTGGAVTLNPTNPISAGTKDGAHLWLIAGHETNTVKIPDPGPLSTLNINGPMTLCKDTTIHLIWIASKGRWIEIGRNN